MRGNALANTLFGNAGANFLDGGGGLDRLYGFDGDDTYLVDSSTDVVIEAVFGGFDTVYTTNNYRLGVTQEIEVLSARDMSSTTNLSLIGNRFDNHIAGNAGNNFIDGEAGVDRMEGFGGNDVYVVDNALDVVIEAQGGGTDVLFSSSDYVLAAGMEVETLDARDVTVASNLYLTGNEFANTVVGNAGDNYIDGAGGVDRLYGFGGDDVFVVDRSEDLVIETVGAGTDTVFTSTNYRLGGNAEIEVLSTRDWAGTSDLILTGNRFANIMFGNAGNNLLDGEAGADTLQGFGGNDRYVVDNSGDRVLEAAGEGNDTILTTVDYTLSNDSFVETLSTRNVLGSTSLNLTGNIHDNNVFGNAGANTLNGGGGNDVLVGLGGADSFLFDSVLGSGNVDQVRDFNIADDTIVLDDAVFAGLQVGTLAAGAFRNGVAAVDADDRIIYNQANGSLLFDADGAGGVDAVQFAVISNQVQLTASDFVVI